MEVLTPGTVLPFASGTAPVQVCIDCAYSSVASSCLRALFTYHEHDIFKFSLQGRFVRQPLQGMCVPGASGGRSIFQVTAFSDKIIEAHRGILQSVPTFLELIRVTIRN